jgi:hypothetical protein
MTSPTKVVVLAMLAACGDGAHRSPDAGTSPPDAAVDAPVDAPPEQATLCRDGWCWVYPQPQGNQVRAIWGASPTDVWALADGATTLHYDGSAWQLGVLPDECVHPFMCQPFALFGTASNDVWAATSRGVFHWDGTRWSASLPGIDALAIGGLGAHDVWAYDFTHQQAVHWDGAAWTPHDQPVAGWRTIALGGSGGTLWNVSNQGGLAKWNGAGWDMVEAGTHPADRGVVIDATHIALNTGAFWNGSDWAVHPPPDQTSFGALAATSLDNVWVSGLPFGVPHRFHWNGTSWETPETPADRGLPLGMWIDGDGRVWAGQDNAQIRVFHDGAWETKTVGDNLVTAAFGTADDEIWAITSLPARALHWNGSTWTEFPLPHDKPYFLSRIWGSAPDDYWIAAGAPGNNVTERHLMHWNGSAWTVEAHGAEPDDEFPSGFKAVWGSSASDVYAVSGTTLWHFDGHAWADTHRDWAGTGRGGGNDVFGSGADDVWVTIGDGNVGHWHGNVWSVIELPEITVYGVANSPTDVWFSGYRTVHYDGNQFTSLGMFTETPPVGTPSAMYTFGPGTMTAWTPGPTTTQAFFEPGGGGFRTPSGRAYASGRGLLVHQ